MTTRKTFIKAYRKRDAKTWPVWEIGDNIQVGDFGTFHWKRFEKQGNIKTLHKDIKNKMKVTSTPVPGLEHFTQSTSLNMEASGGGSPQPGQSVDGKLELSSKKALYFEAVDIVEHAISNLKEITDILLKKKLLKKKFVVVTSVRTLKNGLVLVSESSDWSINVTGEMPQAPATLASASIGISQASGTGYRKKVDGTTPIHPFAMKLVGKKGIWNKEYVLKTVDDEGVIESDLGDITEELDDEYLDELVAS